MKKSAFTLAEIMIVLTVIGILTGILMPIAFHSAPDEDVMKTKKAYNALTTAIREMVNSDKYYLDGDLGVYPDGNLISDPTYNCKVMADILNIKKSDCDSMANFRVGHKQAWLKVSPKGFYVDDSTGVTAEDTIDYTCLWAQQELTSVPLELENGAIVYDAYPHTMFGDVYSDNRRQAFDKNAAGMEENYKDLCFDIDGIGRVDKDFHLNNIIGADVDDDTVLELQKEICDGVCPFGIGVRYDGKIYLGRFARIWLEKSVQKGE